MKVLPAAVLVLLAFAAFFMTFLVAPLAVLTLFYVGYSVRTRAGSKPAAAAPEESQHQWGLHDEPEAKLEEEPEGPPQARRPRVTVESHRERAAALEAAALEAAEQAAGEDADDVIVAAAGTHDGGGPGAGA